MNKISVDKNSEKSNEEKVKLTLPNEILSALDRYIDSTRFHVLSNILTYAHNHLLTH